MSSNGAYRNLTLHIGIQKTGTTFIQNAIFPYWKGISYIPRDNLELLLRADDSKPMLLSREGLSGQNWAHHNIREQSIERLAGLFPNAKIMLSFRQHSKYIVSSYSQYLQRGGYLKFNEYFNPKDDSGQMKLDDFRFALKISAVERFFGRTPFVFLQEELHGGGLSKLLKEMEKFIGGEAPNTEDIKHKKYNKSVKYHPAILLRFLNKHSRSELNPNGRLPLYSENLVRLKLDPRSITQYLLQFAPGRAMIPAELSKYIDSSYADDWQFVKSIAAARTDL